METKTETTRSGQPVPSGDAIEKAIEISGNNPEVKDYLLGLVEKIKKDIAPSLLQSINWIAELSKRAESKDETNKDGAYSGQEVESYAKIFAAVRAALSAIGLQKIPAKAFSFGVGAFKGGLLTVYGKDGDHIDPSVEENEPVIKSLNTIVDGWLMKNNIFRQKGEFYQIDENTGKPQVDAQNNLVMLDPEEVEKRMRDPNSGIREYFANTLKEGAGKDGSVRFISEEEEAMKQRLAIAAMPEQEEAAAEKAGVKEALEAKKEVAEEKTAVEKEEAQEEEKPQAPQAPQA